MKDQNQYFGVVFPTLQTAQSTHEAVDVTERHDKMARQPGGNRAVEKLSVVVFRGRSRCLQKCLFSWEHALYV